MGCSTCGKNRIDAYQNRDTLKFPPLNASDIMVFDGSVRRFEDRDWPDGNKLLLCMESVTQEEVDKIHVSVNPNIQTVILTSESINLVRGNIADCYGINIWSSYLLPSRLGIMKNGRARRSAVIILSGGDISVIEMFFYNDFNLDYLYSQLMEAVSKI